MAVVPVMTLAGLIVWRLWQRQQWLTLESHQEGLDYAPWTGQAKFAIWKEQGPNRAAAAREEKLQAPKVGAGETRDAESKRAFRPGVRDRKRW